MFHKAIDLRFNEGTSLEVTFQDGQVKQYDMSVLFESILNLKLLRTEIFLFQENCRDTTVLYGMILSILKLKPFIRMVIQWRSMKNRPLSKREKRLKQPGKRKRSRSLSCPSEPEYIRLKYPSLKGEYLILL